MHSLDAIEAINIDQLVTATDRLLLRCKRTVARPGQRSTIELSREASAALAASKARAAVVVEEKTVYVRASRKSRELVAAAAIIVGAWLGVVCACLLT